MVPALLGLFHVPEAVETAAPVKKAASRSRSRGFAAQVAETAHTCRAVQLDVEDEVLSTLGLSRHARSGHSDGSSSKRHVTVVPGIHTMSRSWRSLLRDSTGLPAFLGVATHERIRELSQRDEIARRRAVCAAVRAWKDQHVREERARAVAGRPTGINSTRLNTAAAPTAEDETPIAARAVESAPISRSSSPGATARGVSVGAAGRSRLAAAGAASLEPAKSAHEFGRAVRKAFEDPAAAGPKRGSGKSTVGADDNVESDGSDDSSPPSGACSAEEWTASVPRGDVATPDSEELSRLAGEAVVRLLRTFSAVRLGAALTLAVGGDPTLPEIAAEHHVSDASSAARFRMAAGALSESDVAAADAAAGLGAQPWRAHVRAPTSHLVRRQASASGMPRLKHDTSAATLIDVLRWWPADVDASDAKAMVDVIMVSPPPPPAVPGLDAAPPSAPASASSAARPRRLARPASLAASSPHDGFLADISRPYGIPHHWRRPDSRGMPRFPLDPATGRPRRPDGDDATVTMADMQILVEALVQRHPDLADVAKDPMLRARYATFVVTFCLGALRGYSATTYRPRDVHASNLVDALIACASNRLAGMTPFSPADFVAYSRQYDWMLRQADAAAASQPRGDATSSTERAEGLTPRHGTAPRDTSPPPVAGTAEPADRVVGPLVNASMLLRASAIGLLPGMFSTPRRGGCSAVPVEAPLNVPAWAVMRVAHGAPRRPASGRPGFLAFEDFMWLALAEKDAMAGPSIEYWCAVLDTDDDGMVGDDDVKSAVRYLERAGRGVSSPNAARTRPGGRKVDEADDAAVVTVPRTAAMSQLVDCLRPASYMGARSGAGTISFTARTVRRRACGPVVFGLLLAVPVKDD